MTSNPNNNDVDGGRSAIATATSTATSTSTTFLSSSLYTQLNEQLRTEIEAAATSSAATTRTNQVPLQEEDSIPTRNIRPLAASTSSTRTSSNFGYQSISMSSYYFGSSSLAQAKHDTKGGKTKISVSIIGDAFVDLFCFLNDGSSAAEGGKLPVLGGDVRVNQPGKPSTAAVLQLLQCSVLCTMYLDLA